MRVPVRPKNYNIRGFKQKLIILWALKRYLRQLILFNFSSKLQVSMPIFVNPGSVKIGSTVNYQ